MNFLIEKKLPAQIKINFEELKMTLKDDIKRYEGLVVTKQTLKSSIASQKELAGLKRKIDTARKDIKRELLIPIQKFESECKELYLLVESAETPIKRQIETFEIKRREEVRKNIEDMLHTEAMDNQISMDVTQIEIPKEMFNKTAKKSSIESFVNGAILNIKLEIERKDKESQAIYRHIKTMNQILGLKSLLKFSDFERDMKVYSHSELIEKITAMAKRQQRTEKEAIERAESIRLQKVEDERIAEQKKLDAIAREKERAEFIEKIKDDPILEDIEPKSSRIEEVLNNQIPEFSKNLVEDIGFVVVDDKEKTETIYQNDETKPPIVVKTKHLEVKLDKPKFVALIKFLSNNDIEYKIK